MNIKGYFDVLDNKQKERIFKMMLALDINNAEVAIIGNEDNKVIYSEYMLKTSDGRLINTGIPIHVKLVNHNLYNENHIIIL